MADSSSNDASTAKTFITPNLDESRRNQLKLHEAALLEVARFQSQQHDDQELTLRVLAEVGSRTLDVDRTSIWVFDEQHTKITCLVLYQRSTREFTKGMELGASDVPAYFAAVAENRSLAAHNAQTDPRTIEMAESYLKPLHITSMLDAPIRLGGQIIGVVCHEHTAQPRVWSDEEQNFAASLSDLAAISIEHSERVRAEAEVRRRDEMLEGVAKAANRMFADAETDLRYVDGLLRAVANIAERSIVARERGGSILALIGEALRASRVCLLDYVGSLPPAKPVGVREAWASTEGLDPLPPLTAASLPALWFEKLNDGEVVGGPVTRLGSSQLALFKPLGVQSMLIAPLAGPLGQTGLLYVDDTSTERDWSSAETQFLRTCGLLLSSV